MGGGIMQLVAYGAQDIYITGNPQITFFKIIYRRHTNFAIETIEHSFIGIPSFGNKVSAKITRNGDLISKMYLRVILSEVDPLNSNFAWVRRIGHALLAQATIEIGGTRIDRQYGVWLDIWYELARQGDHEVGYDRMIGDIDDLTDYNSFTKREYALYIPLQFWFNRYIGLAIPLISLQYHDVYLHIDFEQVNKLIVYDCNFDITRVTMKEATVLTNYIFLDTEERRRFALVGHEYLIDQIQFNGIEPVIEGEKKYTMDFNHPTKEIIWATRNGNYISSKSFVYYTNKDEWSLEEASCTIIKKSISIGTNPEPIVGGTWIEVVSSSTFTVGTFNVTNNNENSVFVNAWSLSIDTYGITDKIVADIVIDDDGTIECNNVVTNLTVRDLSIPVELMTDTRYDVCDPRVNIFSNYGLLIDGSNNPIDYALIQFNGHDRFDRREGKYFNYVQPEQHHENTTKDGINVYSFALYPEQHQPSGTANLSRIDSSQLITWLRDVTMDTELPSINYFNDDSQLFIFAPNYNILRIYAGLSGLAYVA
jgi:hypothetical protein